MISTRWSYRGASPTLTNCASTSRRCTSSDPCSMGGSPWRPSATAPGHWSKPAWYHGRTLTSWPSLKTDIANAGGNWVDEEVIVDTEGPNTLITSRKPDDLKAFNREVTEALARLRS